MIDVLSKLRNVQKGLQQEKRRQQDDELANERAPRDLADNFWMRAAGRPVTYFGVTAASSITKPADLVPALAAPAATSSSEDAASFAIAATSSTRSWLALSV